MAPLLLLLLALCAASPLAAQQPVSLSGTVYDSTEFNPPATVPPTIAQLRRLRERVGADPAAARAFQAVRAVADSALTLQPAPLREIAYEGRVGTDPERLRTIRHLHDLRRLRALSWSYALTGEARYRDAARRFLSAWVDTYRPTGNPINDSRVVDVMLAYHLLRPELSAAEHSAVHQWMRAMAERELASEPANPRGNWHARRIHLAALIGTLLGDPALVGYARREAEQYVAGSLNPDGTSYDLHHRDALHYHVSGIDPLLEIALILRRSSYDLYSYRTPEGASVRRSVEYVLPYARGERVHPEWTRSRVALDRKRWESGDQYYRPGKPWDPREALEMYRMASIFDPALADVARALAGPEPAWEQVVMEEMR